MHGEKKFISILTSRSKNIRILITILKFLDTHWCQINKNIMLIGKLAPSSFPWNLGRSKALSSFAISQRLHKSIISYKAFTPMMQTVFHCSLTFCSFSLFASTWYIQLLSKHEDYNPESDNARLRIRFLVIIRKQNLPLNNQGSWNWLKKHL